MISTTMKYAKTVITVITVLGSLWFISPALSMEVRLNLTERPVNQSSTYFDSRCGSAEASRAIDGNYDTDVWAKSCSHTLDHPNGTTWWRVDLGQPVKVLRILLVNRGDCCGSRMDYFVVGLSNSSLDPVRGDYALCGQYPGRAADGAYLNLLCNPRTASGRFVIVQQNINEQGAMAICEIEIYAEQVRNSDLLEIRLNLTGRPATQSSTFFGSYCGAADASRAIDGNYNPIMKGFSCSHTMDPADDGRSWWRVDLGQPVKVQRVVIVNRRDCCGYRMDYFVVGLSNSSLDPVRGDYALCGQYPGPAADGAYLNLHCNPRSASGRFVIVQQNITAKGGITICEIEIYAGEVRNLNKWSRITNQRLTSVNAIILDVHVYSVMRCIAKCQETVGCDSINHRLSDNRCEMNFLPPGANGTREVIEDGWNNWVQMYEFI